MTQGQLMFWIFGGLVGCIVIGATVGITVTLLGRRREAIDLSALVRKWRSRRVPDGVDGDYVYDECADELDAVLKRLRK